MKKIMIGLAGYLIAGSAWSATVTIDSVGGNYGTDGQTYLENGTAYEVFLKNALIDPSVNAGEELVYLGAHESLGSNSGDPNIVVDIDKVGEGTTASLSLVLSAAESTVWDFQIEAGVQIKNIYIIGQGGLGSQVLQFGGQTIDLGLGQQTIVDTTFIARSLSPSCGYEYPYMGGGCNTDEILGLPNQSIDGENTNLFGDNLLGDLTPLQVTDFAGTYFAGEFNIGVDSVVIPLPPSVVLFASALLGVAGLRQSYTRNC